MRKYINVFLLFTIVFAILPFFLSGKEGKPLIDLSKKSPPTLWTPTPKSNTSTSPILSAPTSGPTSSTKSPENMVFYKWQDQNGNWQYSNIKPEHQNVIEVAISPDTNILQALKSEMDSDKSKREGNAKSAGVSTEDKQNRAFEAVISR